MWGLMRAEVKNGGGEGSLSWGFWWREVSTLLDRRVKRTILVALQTKILRMGGNGRVAQW